MTQTPAGWYVDPQDASQHRYWDGTAWTEHRAPRGPAPGSASDQLTRAGGQLADGLAKGFTAVGTWVQQNTAPRQPTFASVAASCTAEPAREPLSVTARLVLGPADLAAIGTAYAVAGIAVTPEGVELTGQECRLVPNPWDPATPNGVAVLVGAVQVGRLPAELEAAYCPPLAQLTTRRLLASGVADLWAQGAGTLAAARVDVRLPEVSALS